MNEAKPSIDLDELQKLAEAATPGPWVADPPRAWDTDDDGGYQMQSSLRVMDAGSITWDDHGGEVFRPEDAEFIAAANPQATLELIERMREAEAERDAATAAIERVRAIAERHGVKSWTEEIFAALDGAPEPECEYRWGDRNHHAFFDESRHEVFDSHIEAKVALNRESDRHEDRVLRRRKAGPWEACGE